MKRLLFASLVLSVATPAAARGFEIAHIREQGQDMIIIPLDKSFGWKSPTSQSEIVFALEECAAGANLAGEVVPVWFDSQGRMNFLAPREWTQFFRSISMKFVAQRINKTLYCN